MHHAIPNRGGGFCTMSGQVIASVKIYRETGLSGAYLDLDGHYGNSIEDSRYFVSDLDAAIPVGCNINPIGVHKSYIDDLKDRLKILGKLILSHKIHYLVFAHGADSHEWDDLRGVCTTKEWIKASEIVYDFVIEMGRKMEKPLPLTLALFGGYRKDDYQSVLSLHTADLLACLNKFSADGKTQIEYMPEISIPRYGRNL